MAGVRLPRFTAGSDRRIGLAWMTHGRVIPLMQNMVIEDTGNLHIFRPSHHLFPLPAFPVSPNQYLISIVIFVRGTHVIVEASAPDSRLKGQFSTLLIFVIYYLHIYSLAHEVLCSNSGRLICQNL